MTLKRLVLLLSQAVSDGKVSSFMVKSKSKEVDYFLDKEVI